MADKVEIRELEFGAEHEIVANQIFEFRIGDLRILCKREHDELWIARHYETPDKKKQPDVEEAAWSRWLLASDNFKLRFKPEFPDRSVVIKPEHPYRIMPGAKSNIYVLMPMSVRIEQVEKKEVVVTTIPTVILSKTWFGSMLEGEGCYWLSTRARKKVDLKTVKEYLTVCSIRINNRSSDDLNFEKMSLNVDRFSIYEHEGCLFSDDININYRGPEDISRIQVSAKPPAVAPKAALVSAARVSDKRSFTKKTFMSIKELMRIEI